MGNPSVMKSFLNFFREARTSQASDTAARQNLTGDGHGNWFDKDGNMVAKTVKGRLEFLQKKQSKGEDDAKRLFWYGSDAEGVFGPASHRRLLELIKKSKSRWSLSYYYFDKKQKGK